MIANLQVAKQVEMLRDVGVAPIKVDGALANVRRSSGAADLVCVRGCPALEVNDKVGASEAFDRRLLAH